MKRFSHKGHCEGREENCGYEKCGVFGNLYLVDGQTDARARLKQCKDKPRLARERKLKPTRLNFASSKTKNNMLKRQSPYVPHMQMGLQLSQQKISFKKTVELG